MRKKDEKIDLFFFFLLSDYSRTMSIFITIFFNWARGNPMQCDLRTKIVFGNNNNNNNIVFDSIRAAIVDSSFTGWYTIESDDFDYSPNGGGDVGRSFVVVVRAGSTYFAP